MNYIKYLYHVPLVPEELLDPIEKIIGQESEVMLVRDFAHFEFKTVNPKLDEWLHSVFKMKCYAKYQVIRNGIAIHKDSPAFPGDRRLAFNYLLQSGGPNVVTTVYDEDKTTILQSECIPLKRWHSLVVEKWHGVEGISNEDPRVAITVTPILSA